jgi:hypothetical protein
MSASSLNDFISSIKRNSLARQNRFTVSISSPAGDQSGRLVELFCEQATLPGIAFASQPVRTYGEQREVVYDRNYESITLTFLVDKDFAVKNYFDQWTDQVINPYTRLVGFYDNYVRDIVIMVQDTKDNDTYIAVLREAYPKSIAAVQLDHNSKDVVKLQVTFNYKYHINNQLVGARANQDDKNVFGFDFPDPYKISRQIGSYIRNGVSTAAAAIPDLYYNNFQQYQENLNDQMAVAEATAKIERQGFETGSGYTSDWY